MLGTHALTLPAPTRLTLHPRRTPPRPTIPMTLFRWRGVVKAGTDIDRVARMHRENPNMPTIYHIFRCDAGVTDGMHLLSCLAASPAGPGPHAPCLFSAGAASP